MSSPLPVQALWLGKCLFVSAVGIVFALVGTCLVLIEVNLILVGAGDFVLPAGPALAFLFVVLPAIALGQCLIMGGLQLLSGNAVLAAMVYLTVGTAYMTIAAMRIEAMRITWAALASYASVAALLAGLSMVLWHRLDRERVTYASG